jgi:lipopolysaccharide transport system permease protein
MTTGAGLVGAFREVIQLTLKHRQLTWEMAQREVTERYTGQLFGALWAIGHPLILMMVYLFIFGVVFKVKIGGTPDMPLDYAAYLFAGMIPWLAFQEAMAKSTTVIVNSSNLVKQVVFPLEVLPAKGVIATVMTQLVFLALLLVYLLVKYQSLSPMVVLLPILLIVQAIAMMGVSYVLSSVGVYLRDTKDLVQVFLVVGAYLMPTFYLPSFVPPQLRALLYLNPFSYMIWCYQDVLYFGRFEHPWAWPVFFGLSLMIFTVGFLTFRRLRTMFGNVL